MKLIATLIDRVRRAWPPTRARELEADRAGWRRRALRAEEYWTRLQEACDHRWHNLHGGGRVCEHCGVRTWSVLEAGGRR